jgi:hypothetical protein
MAESHRLRSAAARANEHAEPRIFCDKANAAALQSASALVERARAAVGTIAHARAAAAENSGEINGTWAAENLQDPYDDHASQSPQATRESAAHSLLNKLRHKSGSPDTKQRPSPGFPPNPPSRMPSQSRECSNTLELPNSPTVRQERSTPTSVAFGSGSQRKARRSPEIEQQRFTEWKERIVAARRQAAAAERGAHHSPISTRRAPPEVFQRLSVDARRSSWGVVFEAHADGRLGRETDSANEGAQDDVLTHAITRQQAVEAVYEAVNEAKGSAPALAGLPPFLIEAHSELTSELAALKLVLFKQPHRGSGGSYQV